MLRCWWREGCSLNRVARKDDPVNQTQPAGRGEGIISGKKSKTASKADVLEGATKCFSGPIFASCGFRQVTFLSDPISF